MEPSRTFEQNIRHLRNLNTELTLVDVPSSTKNNNQEEVVKLEMEQLESPQHNNEEVKLTAEQLERAKRNIEVQTWLYNDNNKEEVVKLEMEQLKSPQHNNEEVKPTAEELERAKRNKEVQKWLYKNLIEIAITQKKIEKELLELQNLHVELIIKLRELKFYEMQMTCMKEEMRLLKHREIKKREKMDKTIKDLIDQLQKISYC